MYKVSRDKLAIINTSVLFCTMVLLIVLVSTGGSSTHETMYWSKRTYFRSSSGNKSVLFEEWYLNYARCLRSFRIGDSFRTTSYSLDGELTCTQSFADFGLGGWGPSSIVSIVGLSLLLITLIISIVSFITWLFSILKTYTFGSLYLLIIVILGFVITFAGTLMMTIIHKLGFKDIEGLGLGLGKLGGSVAVAWLSTCLYLISVILSVIIFRARGEREVSQESVS